MPLLEESGTMSRKWFLYTLNVVFKRAEHPTEVCLFQKIYIYLLSACWSSGSVLSTGLLLSRSLHSTGGEIDNKQVNNMIFDSDKYAVKETSCYCMCGGGGVVLYMVVTREASLGR